MSTQFTRGPWHTGSDGCTIVRPHPQANSKFAREQGYIIARCEYPMDARTRQPLAEAKANARLIAAAPALYEALRIAQTLIERDIVRDGAGCLAKVNAALALVDAESEAL